MIKKFRIKSDWRLGKVKHIVNEVKKMIHKGKLCGNEQMPSINSFSRQYHVSRDTVEKAYSILKKEGYLASIKGIGYFVEPRLEKDFKVLFILNEFNSDQSKKHENLFFELSGMINIDLCVYHNNLETFDNIIRDNYNSYNYYYLILPRSIPPVKQRKIDDIIDRIPDTKRLVLQERA